jgi:hypothetical protein
MKAPYFETCINESGQLRANICNMGDHDLELITDAIELYIKLHKDELSNDQHQLFKKIVEGEITFLELQLLNK